VRTATFVLAVFALILTGCVSSEPATTSPDRTSSAEVERLRQRVNELEQDLIDARKRADSSRRGETVEILSTDLYFESGSAKLSAEGVDKLVGIANRIKREYGSRVLRVEGYTDDTPIGDRLKETYPSNWELSAARAAAVVRHLQWTHEIDPDRFEVVGYGPYQPVASNETAEGRRQNRRVRVAVLPAQNPNATQTSMQKGGRW